MDRLAKRECVDHLRQSVYQSPCILVVRHSGLSSKYISTFRRRVRDAGGSFQVVKNTLAKKALGEDAEFSKAFRFSTAVLFSKDPITLSKVSVEFAKEQRDRFQIVLGRLDGVLLSESQIIELSSLPSLEALQTSLLRVFNGVASHLLSVFQTPAQGMVTVLGAR
ncbi:50S ribosomal protein L10 [Holospora curviuscula]|uniref:Large ribosomal subunit protein uL10 n=1 Tax=Holospora curviuscula TaxID=1082868 RepID=A0A2S5R9K0_9PROT|nr:50S ribosomal protein L10 [Holospora curviuscula]PPE03980.1 50S ribosomal protein L10 [Holospora curviuscula]